jgi:hypothetical protein
MYLMYVDESGDTGLSNSPTNYFVLSGLVLHELKWKATLDQLIDFRRRMQRAFGLRLREEIHAARFITSPGPLVRIKRNDRLTILRSLANELASMTHLNVINVVVTKANKRQGYDAFGMAWRALVQRFSNTMNCHNFPPPRNQEDMGIILPDHTDNRKVIQLLRQMRRFNPVPHQPQFGLGYRNLLVANVPEDPSFRQSSHSYFIQAADLVAFLMYQRLTPNAYMRKRGGHKYFDRLDPILCKVASSSDPQGIVRL